MRYDTPIFFQRIRQGEYNPATGNYEEDVITEEKRWADKTSTGVETLRMVYGELRQGSFVIRLRSHYRDPFDRIRIGNKVYRSDFERKLRKGHVFVVSEVQ